MVCLGITQQQTNPAPLGLEMENRYSLNVKRVMHRVLGEAAVMRGTYECVCVCAVLSVCVYV